jgi:hypothetical protein
VEESRQRRDEAHRAIGRYVVVFSMLVKDMREGIELALSGRPASNSTLDPMIPRLAMGEAFAAQITNAYFAICARLGDFDEEEKGVGTRLKNEVLDVISDRNDFAHGDWDLGPIPGVQEPSFRRVKPGRKAGAWTLTVKSVDEIDAMTDEIIELDNRVAEFGWLCLGLHPLSETKGLDPRVRDIFRLQNRRVHRKGRYADIPWFEPDDE